MNKLLAWLASLVRADRRITEDLNNFVTRVMAWLAMRVILTETAGEVLILTIVILLIIGTILGVLAGVIWFMFALGL